MAVIEVENLAKRYGDIDAVRDVTLQVEEGEVFALLGPNGAGKSTTVEILEGHRTRTSGRVSVLGVDPETAGREFRDRIGIVLQSSGIEDELTVREALEFYGASYTNPRDPMEVLEMVGLTEAVDRRVSALSGGQQRRIDLGLGLVGRPDLLFLDEPTTGFDPSARRQSWELIAGLRELGTTIVLTTHYMEEAELLADRVAVIVRGEIAKVDVDKDQAMAAQLGVRGIPALFSFKNGAGMPRTAMDGFPVGDAERIGDEVICRTMTATQTLHDVTGWALGRGIELTDLQAARPSLEDVYLELAHEGETS